MVKLQRKWSKPSSLPANIWLDFVESIKLRCQSLFLSS